jgi:hypothetical protein
MVVIDYDKVERQIKAYLVVARIAGCRCFTVNVPTGDLLYLGNRTADAIAAIKDKHCEVFYLTSVNSGTRVHGRGNS